MGYQADTYGGIRLTYGGNRLTRMVYQTDTYGVSG